MPLAKFDINKRGLKTLAGILIDMTKEEDPKEVVQEKKQRVPKKTLLASGGKTKAAKADKDVLAKADKDVLAKAGKDVLAKAGKDVLAKAGKDVLAKAGKDVLAKAEKDVLAKAEKDVVAKLTKVKPVVAKPGPVKEKPTIDLPKVDKAKKRNIPKRVKDLSWEKWIGKDIAIHPCLCCGKNEIRMNSFHCGHVLAEADGGLSVPDNLRPICADCNLSMGRENFNDFKARCGFNKPVPKKKPVVKKKETTKKDDIDNKKIIELLINNWKKNL